MYKCDYCGRESFKKIRYGGHTVCSKHMHQLHKYGHVLDTIQRTNSDLNDYEIVDNTAIFNLYNQKNVKIGQFIIDAEDLDKVKYRKWRLSHGGAVTGLPSKGTQKDLSHIILGVTPQDNTVVDHINGNRLDNRKSNLRMCSQADNVCNKSFMSDNSIGFIGISYDKCRNCYCPEIRKDGIRCHLPRQKTLEEAVYARYITEQAVFFDFANEDELDGKREACLSLSVEQKERIYDQVLHKLTLKGLWQLAM